MNPRIIDMPDTLLAGKRLRMSLTHDATVNLWSSFMPRRKEIKQAVNESLISVTVYDDDFELHQFKPDTLFDKWACIEVSSQDELPEGFETYTIPAGSYAVFVYQGLPQMAMQFFRKIFMEYLPSSPYELANGPHFAVMGEKYKGNDPTSEEEIYIPIQRKK